MPRKNNGFRFTVLAFLLLGGTVCQVRGWNEAPNMNTNGSPVAYHEFDFSPAGPEARKELSVKREEIFEFVAPPRVTRAGDRVDIYFESKAFCDATVAIENANGKIVRYLASGVLGSNAPEPFEKNSKKQHVVWNGKDDFGVYIDDKDALTVRVSLGLKASFEKNLHHYPMPDFCRAPIVHAGPEGVFIYNSINNSVWDYLIQFDHEGNYVKTLHPFAASALDKIKGLNWVYAWPEDRKVPAKSFDVHGSLLPFRTSQFDPPAVTDFTVRNGWITMLGRPDFARLGTDGTTRGQELTGGPTALAPLNHSAGKGYAHRSAMSPDGRWIYLARAFDGPDKDDTVFNARDHAIYRMPFDGSAAPQVFLGDPKKKGSDNEHFNSPSGIAIDAQGRIYVSDWDNDRVQVFSPEGKILKTIPAVGPADIALNQKNGEIYVFSWLWRARNWYGGIGDPIVWNEDGAYNLRATPIRVKKYRSFDAGAGLVYEEKLMEGGSRSNGLIIASTMRAEVDGWGAQPVIWLFDYSNPSRLLTWKEVNNKLTPYRDFAKERETAGVKTGYSGAYRYGLLRQFLYFDPKHQVLYAGETHQNENKYFDNLLAIDVASGHERIVTLPFAAADAAIDAKGRIYLLNDDMIGRFDLETWNEVPFDYGKEFGKSGKIVSAVQTIGGHTSSFKHQSLGVSPQGDVVVAGYKAIEEEDRRKDTTMHYGMRPWRPVVYPGRPANKVCVNVFNIYGELVHADVLAGIESVTGGLDMDWQNNIYAAETGARMLDKRPIKFNTGTLIKFPPQGGRFITDNVAAAMAPLDKRPEGPAPISGGVWAEGAQWMFGGTPVGLIWLNCACLQARFKTDYFGRTFVPESWRYSVAVLDNAGNVIMRIGQYGNVDSAGPKSLVPLGGDEIGLFDPRFITLDTDKRVFIGDPANDRIVSGLLDYHVNQRLPLKEISDEGARKP
jgi:DNA-binding beta-propeller fold protein YncE